jgi:uncharacterized delta-60 repeat protein
MNRVARSIIILLGFALLTDSRANDGEYLGLRYQIDVSAGSDYGIGMRIQPDGKLLLVGTCAVPAYEFCAARLNRDATYDTTFGSANLGYQTFVVNDVPPTPASAFLLLPDGRTVIIGTVDTSDAYVGLIERIDANGQFETWNTVHLTNASHPYPILTAMALQSDGEIVIVGSANRDATGNRDFAITRINAGDLSHDASFNHDDFKFIAFDLNGPSGPAGDEAVAVAIQGDGKIVVGGYSDSPGGSIQPTLTRLLPDGSTDLSFGVSGRSVQSWGTYGRLASMVIDRDGSIVLAGFGYETQSSSPTFVVSRLAPDGSLDPNFGKCFLPVCVPQPVFIDFPYFTDGSSYATSLTIQSDGKILIAGRTQRDASGNSFFAVARVDQDGNLDPSFGAGGLSVGISGPDPGLNDDAKSIQIGNGGIMISGTTFDVAESKYRFSTARLSLDLIFSSRFEARR